jgi:hypothetical protein
MSWVITGSEKNPVDLYRSQVSILLHGDGTNGSTVITDNSPSPKTVTAVGNAQISTAQSKFGGSSIAFDGTGDYLSIPDNDAFDLGTGDFTIEGWVNYSSSTTFATALTKGWPTGSAGGAFLVTLVVGNLVFYAESGSNSWDIASARSIVSGLQLLTWYHIAITRSGNTFRTFSNGVVAETWTSSLGLFNNSDIVSVGASKTGSNGMNGYIDDLRITKGVARYTANFTPPTAQFPDI